MSNLAFAADVQKKPDGKALYAARCASCHAKDGKGNPKMKGMAGGDLAKLDLTDKATSDKKDADLEKLTRDGVNKMPAYKGKLTDGEINVIIRYIRTLQPKKK
jgi:cytochrome c6